MSAPKRRAKLDDIARIANALREPEQDVPDFTVSILERVHSEKPFLSDGARRWTPVVRIGAVCATLAVVFVGTLIVFVNPSLPEQLGAPPSVTSDLVHSAETGVTHRMDMLRESVQAVQRATLTAARELKESALVSDATPHITQAEVAAAADIRPKAPASNTTLVAFVTIPGPVPSPVPVNLPYTTMAGGDVGVFASDVPPSAGFLNGDAGSLGWGGAGFGSFRTYGRSSSMSDFPTSARPTFNRGSPTVVKELLPLITGQPAGDEEIVR